MVQEVESIEKSVQVDTPIKDAEPKLQEVRQKKEKVAVTYAKVLKNQQRLQELWEVIEKPVDREVVQKVQEIEKFTSRVENAVKALSDIIASFKNTFITKWEVPNNGKIGLPLYRDGTYHLHVDWGDGREDDIRSWNDPAKMHDYTKAGVYTVKIYGDLHGWSVGNQDTGNDAILSHLIAVKRWGRMKFGTKGRAFYNAQKLKTLPPEAPDLSSVRNMQGMFFNAKVFNHSLSNWDVRNVQVMQRMFLNAESFNQDLSGWSVGNVNNMKAMFRNAKDFNQDLSGWSVDRVRQFDHIFKGASKMKKNQKPSAFMR